MTPHHNPLNPYRRSRRGHTTVMVRLQRKFLNEILWPEYLQLGAGAGAGREHPVRQADDGVESAVC